MKSFTFLTFFLLSTFSFSQQKKVLMKLQKSNCFSRLDIANDGTSSIIIRGKKDGIQSILYKYNPDGELLETKEVETFPDYFNTEDKFWLGFTGGNKHGVLKHMDQDGKTTSTFIEHPSINSEDFSIMEKPNGNIDIIIPLPTGPAPISGIDHIPYLFIEYNPVGKIYTIQDFSSIPNLSGIIRYIGSREGEAFFAVVNRQKETEKVVVSVVAINKQNDVREVGKVEAPAFQNGHAYAGTEAVKPYFGSFLEKDDIYFTINSKITKGEGINSLHPVFNYKVYKINAKNEISNTELNFTGIAANLPHSNVNFIQKEEQTGFIVNGSVTYTDFESEPEKEEFNIYCRFRLLFPEEKYQAFCNEAIHRNQVKFHVCDDGIARMLTLIANTSFTFTFYKE